MYRPHHPHHHHKMNRATALAALAAMMVQRDNHGFHLIQTSLLPRTAPTQKALIRRFQWNPLISSKSLDCRGGYTDFVFCYFTMPSICFLFFFLPFFTFLLLINIILFSLLLILFFLFFSNSLSLYVSRISYCTTVLRSRLL